MTTESIAGGYRTGRAATAERDLTDALHRLGGLLGALIPAFLLTYMLILWPIAFGDSSVSIEEMAMGWLAPMSSDESSPLKQVAYPLLLALSAFACMATASYRRIPYLNPGVAAALLLMLLAALSTLWSAEPGITVMRAALLAGIAATLFMAVYSATSFSLMMRAIFFVLVATTLVNLWSVAVQPPGPIGHNGIYPQKNMFGWVAAVLLFFGLYSLASGGLMQRAASLLMVLAAPIFLLASESKTSLGLALICPLIALILVYAARRMRLSPALLVVTGILVFTGLFFLGKAAGVWTFFSVNEAIFGDGTLTGRTDIWTFASELIGQRPLLGYGYEAVWHTGYEGIAYRNALGFTRIAPTGHNGYVDMLLHLGFVGFALLVVMLVAMLAVAGRLARLDARLGWLALTTLIFILLHNNFESDIMVSSNPLSQLLILFFLLGLRLTRRQA